MTPDEQEALSRKCSNDVILLLPLSSGRTALFNNARELLGIGPPMSNRFFTDWIIGNFKPPEPAKPEPRAYGARLDPMEDLGI